MVFIHKELAAGRWFQLTLAEPCPALLGGEARKRSEKKKREKERSLFRYEAGEWGERCRSVV